MKILTVVGARPQFIKAAPVGRALREAGHQEVIVHTGQHYDDAMNDVFFRELGIALPEVNLGVGSGGHGQQTGQMLIGLERELVRVKPDWVLVFGDTNSTLAGALAAAKLHLPVAHVEAGVRSYRREMAEEVNRVVADQLSSRLFCVTPTGPENLRREGITEGVCLVGDVMFDALLQFLPLAQKSDVLHRLGVTPGQYALLTAHRAETVDSDARLGALLEAVARIEMPIVFPAHPRTRKRMEALGLDRLLPAEVKVVEPFGYLDMLCLESRARVILTDSGGVQREAFFLRVPSIVLRAETEWPELVEAGASVLVGDSFAALRVDEEWTRRSIDPGTVFGSGDASVQIARSLGSS